MEITEKERLMLVEKKRTDMWINIEKFGHEG